MCRAYSEKREQRNNGRNRTALSGKCKNTWRKTKLQILGSGYHQTNKDVKKSKKEVTQKRQKASRNQILLVESHQRNIQQGSPSWMIIETIPKMDKEETQTNGPKNWKVDDNAKDFTLEWWGIYQEKKLEAHSASVEICVDATILGFEK